MVLSNAEGVRSKLAYKDTLLRSYVNSQIAQVVSAISPLYSPDQFELETEHILDPKDIDTYMRTTYLESREITSSKLLQYLTKKLRIKEIKNEAFKHALISSIEVVYLSSLDNDVQLEVINPLNFFYHKSPDKRFIQDSLYA
ncbi:MAG: hypothetical protein ACRDBG_13855, partial [Waterburya sp.]